MGFVLVLCALEPFCASAR